MADSERDAQKLGPAMLHELSKHGVARLFRERTVLVTEGEKTDALYIILDGRVRAYVSDAAGREVTLSVMGPGEFFGEVAFDHGPRSASVVALEPARLLVVRRDEFAAFLESHPGFAHLFINKLIHHIRVLTENVRSLTLMDALGRVARVLLENAVAESGQHIVPASFTEAEIARRAGCPPEVAGRILSDLQRGGHIALLPGGRILLHRKE